LNDILKKARPELSSETASDLKKIEHYLMNDEKKLFEDEYKDLVKKVLGVLSPETLAEYKGYNIKFVPDKDISYPTTREIERCKQLHLPTRYEYPVQCMILRCVDEILKVKLENAGDIAQDFAMRVEITARVFQINMQLGHQYGWNIKGYKLVEQYYKDYNDGIYIRVLMLEL
jgi:hypothetical protein